MATVSEQEIALLRRGAQAIAQLKDLGLQENEIQAVLQQGAEELARDERRSKRARPFEKQTELVTIQDPVTGQNKQVLREIPQPEKQNLREGRTGGIGAALNSFFGGGPETSRPEITQQSINKVIAQLQEADAGLREDETLRRGDFGQRSLEGNKKQLGDKEQRDYVEAGLADPSGEDNRLAEEQRGYIRRGAAGEQEALQEADIEDILKSEARDERRLKESRELIAKAEAASRFRNPLLEYGDRRDPIGAYNAVAPRGAGARDALQRLTAAMISRNVDLGTVEVKDPITRAYDLKFGEGGINRYPERYQGKGGRKPKRRQQHLVPRSDISVDAGALQDRLVQLADPGLADAAQVRQEKNAVRALLATDLLASETNPVLNMAAATGFDRQLAAERDLRGMMMDDYASGLSQRKGLRTPDRIQKGIQLQNVDFLDPTFSGISTSNPNAADNIAAAYGAALGGPGGSYDADVRLPITRFASDSFIAPIGMPYQDTPAKRAARKLNQRDNRVEPDLAQAQQNLDRIDLVNDPETLARDFGMVPESTVVAGSNTPDTHNNLNAPSPDSAISWVARQVNAEGNAERFKETQIPQVDITGAVTNLDRTIKTQLAKRTAKVRKPFLAEAGVQDMNKLETGRAFSDEFIESIRERRIKDLWRGRYPGARNF